MKLKFLLLLLLPLLYNCKDECDDVGCPSGASFIYNLIDANGNNLYTIQDNEYNEENLEIINFIGDQEVEFRGTIDHNNHIIFVVKENIDSIQVIYNKNHKDTFIAKNLKFRSLECCGSFVDNFDLSRNGEEFCKDCSNEVWTIEK